MIETPRTDAAWAAAHNPENNCVMVDILIAATRNLEIELAEKTRALSEERKAREGMSRSYERACGDVKWLIASKEEVDGAYDRLREYAEKLAAVAREDLAWHEEQEEIFRNLGHDSQAEYHKARVGLLRAALSINSTDQRDAASREVAPMNSGPRPDSSLTDSASASHQQAPLGVLTDTERAARICEGHADDRANEGLKGHAEGAMECARMIRGRAVPSQGSAE